MKLICIKFPSYERGNGKINNKLQDDWAAKETSSRFMIKPKETFLLISFLSHNKLQDDLQDKGTMLTKLKSPKIYGKRY